MQTQKDLAEDGATTHPEGKGSAQGAQGSRITHGAMARDGNHTPQKFVGTDRRIRAGEPVAPREQVVSRYTQNPVDEKTALAEKKHDIAPRNLGGLNAVDDQQVPRPKRRQHAGTGDLEAKLPETSEDLRSQVALAWLIRGGDGGRYNHARDYEFFLFVRH